MLDNLIKGVNVTQTIIRIDKFGNEHLFIENKSGSIVHVWADKGIVRTVLNVVSGNDYFYCAYSIESNCYYYWNQDGLDLIEYNPITGETTFYNMQINGGWPYANPTEFNARYPPLPYIPHISTDGNIYIGQYLVNGVYGYQRFNVTTKEFDAHSAIPDKEFSHIYMRFSNSAFSIDTGSLAGVYSTYTFSDVGDGYVDLRDTILAEIASAGLVFPNRGYIFLNYADRSLASPTRRIYALITQSVGVVYWTIIDIKSPSTYIRTNYSLDVYGNLTAPKAYPCVDQTGASVSTAGWSTLQGVYSFPAITGLTTPTLNPVIAYGTPQFIGRFIYVGQSYMANKSIFYNFVIHPDTGNAVYTYSFNKLETYCQSSKADYVCNFGGAHGFSSDVEIVRFLSDNVGNWYFFSPATKAFVAYNPTTNPSGYVIRAIDMDDITDPLGFGVYSEGRFTQSVESIINDEPYYADPNSFSKVAVAQNYEQELVGDITDVTYKVLPDKSKPDQSFEFHVGDLYAQVGDVSQAINVRDDKIIVCGQVYSGISCIDLIDSNTFTLKKYFGGAISPNGAIRVNANTIFVYGYSGISHVIDATDWNNVKKSNIPSGETNEIIYATVRPEGVLTLGQASRSANYYTGCSFNLVDIIAKTTTSLSYRFPKEFSFSSAPAIRVATGLSGSSYSDGAVAAAILVYMARSGKTRAQVIAEFLDTGRWKISDAHTYGNKTVVGLTYKTVLGLDGIRIEQTVGSGIWIDQNYYAGQGGKALLIDTTNIAAVAPSEIKPVQFNLTPAVTSMGRVAGSSLRLAFVINDPTNSQGIIRVVTKAAFETAAMGSGIITALERTITVNFGTTDAGYGFGDGGNFDSYNTWQGNAYVCDGDILYITCKSNVLDGSEYPCVLKVTLNTGVVETFVKSDTIVTGSISTLDDRMLISRGSNVAVIENFRSQVGSVTI